MVTGWQAWAHFNVRSYAGRKKWPKDGVPFNRIDR